MNAPAKPLLSPAEFERLLVEFINVTVLAGKATVDRDTRLFEDGYMNSLRVLDLIAFVEKTLGMRIPDRAVRLATFRTIGTIVGAFHPDASAVPAPLTAPERVFERRSDRSRFTSPIEALTNRGDLRLTGPGQVALSGLALDVFTAVDQTVVRWARDLGAAEQQYPGLIETATLERAGRARVIPSGAPPSAAPLGMTKPPAVCYHAYPTWAGKTIAPNAELLTAVGECHRHEDGNYAPLERLADFTMREIIIVGTRDQVESHRQALVTRVSELVTQLDLDAAIEPASDPFFTSADEGRRLMQQLGALKLELHLAVDASGRTIAAASFNHHHDYFGTRFDFRLADGTPAHSGCVAFGLERWTLAVMAQHGVNEQTWPNAVRTWLHDARKSEVSA